RAWRGRDDGVDRRFRRADRADRLRGLEGRRGRAHAAGRARPVAPRHPRLHDRAGNVRHASARGAPSGGTRCAGCADPVPLAPGQAGRVRRLGLPHRGEPDAERGDDQARRRAADATEISGPPRAGRTPGARYRSRARSATAAPARAAAVAASFAAVTACLAAVRASRAALPASFVAECADLPALPAVRRACLLLAVAAFLLRVAAAFLAAADLCTLV